METGRGSLLESYAIVSALLDFGFPVLAYAHHNFTLDHRANEINTTSLQDFYVRVRELSMEQYIIPIRGTQP